MEAISAQGNDVPDAYLAALALEWDCDRVTTDKQQFFSMILIIWNISAV